MNPTATCTTHWIRRAALFAFTALIGTAVFLPDAEAARRMGGGKSFGRQANPPSQPPAQRDAMKQPTQQPAQAGPAQPAGAGAPAAGNRWLGPIAGIAAGLGIAALLSHLGLSEAFAQFLASALVIGLLVVAGLFVWRMLRGTHAARPLERRAQPAYAGASAPQPRARPSSAYVPQAGGQARPGSVAATIGAEEVSEGAQSVAAGGQIPADFDVPGFLRNAKVHFYRLQASWDRRDLADLGEFTTPEVFAELRTQLSEEPAHSARNEVTALEADLLGIEEGPADWLASVRFRGQIREEGAGQAEEFEEIWNLAKRKDGRAGWLLAGIQQVH
jgi:predicted lipid-binding transport protein (Tim44 family)